MCFIRTRSTFSSQRQTTHICVFSYIRDVLNLDPMTLMFDLDLDIMKMYMCIKNEVCRSTYSKSLNRQRQTRLNVLQLHIRWWYK